ncbi:hypothetical protein P7L78_03160 (plasmid) [Tistrella bauzanensis]|uniref:Isoquinoline 1-oxidoreductase subunit n=1 Tax=Tistrella TaxID=171436 RepID=UPI0031F691AA
MRGGLMRGGLMRGGPTTLAGLATAGLLSLAALMPAAHAAGMSANDTAAADDPQSLRPVTAFNGIGSEAERSAALFGEAAKVLQHPRCMNCHPAGDRPAQGDDRHPHRPLVVRGDGGMGVVGMRCTTCHHDENYEPAGVPGDPHWSLAPPEMAWEGLSVGQICAQLKDPARNGDRDLAAIIEHVSTDSLVLWGWAPGGTRAPAPGSNAAFTQLMQAWVDTGAHCPAG